MIMILELPLLGASCREPIGAEHEVRTRWYVEQPGARTQSRPAVVGDIVYFGTSNGRLVARNRANGLQHWAADAVDTEVSGANIITRPGVIVVAGTFQVAAVDAASGAVLWRYDSPPDTVGAGTGAPPRGQLLKSRLDADANYVYVPAWGASVSAVELTTGRARWVWRPGPSAGDTAVSGVFRSGAEGVRVSGDTVLVTAWHFLDRLGLKSEPWLVALDRATGTELWRVVIPSYTGGASVQGAPALYENLAIFTGTGGRVWAVNRTSAQIVWQFAAPTARYATVTQAEGFGQFVYIDGGDERTYALRAADGSMVWSADGGATRDLLATEKRVYVPSGATIWILDRADGRLITTASARRVGDAVQTPLTFADGAVFVGLAPAAWSFDEP
jgi:outer membrane protein assembly factor BamB